MGILEDSSVNLVLTQQMLGNLDALYLAAYAVGQFVWGAVAEKWGGTVDLDLASQSDRQGIGGPSARGE